MAFNLKKVLKALLLSSNQPLAIKDVQAAITRFHETASALPFAVDEGDGAAAPAGASDGAAPASAPTAAPAVDASSIAGAASVAASAEGAMSPAVPTAATPTAPAGEEPTEVVEDAPQDPELYTDVPSLITATQIREAMDQIAVELRAADDGLLLIEGNAGYRIVTHPRFARWVRILRQEPPPVKLSQSAVETLAVIAYRQPVTRTEIETIRGVSAEAGVNKLLERDLIYVVGRADSPGRPIQYGTTDQFLEFVGIKSLDELPASDVLSSRQIDEWLKTSENKPRPTDTDMGLPDEQLPLDAPTPTVASSEREPADEATTGVSAEAPASAEKSGDAPANT